VTFKYTKLGNIVVLSLPRTNVAFSATSNATTKTFTGMPASLFPSNTIISLGAASDNGGSYLAAQTTITSDGVIHMYTTANGDSWTSSGTAGFYMPMLTYVTA
jgi:hypothetical protein